MLGHSVVIMQPGCYIVKFLQISVLTDKFVYPHTLIIYDFVLNVSEHSCVIFSWENNRHRIETSLFHNTLDVYQQ